MPRTRESGAGGLYAIKRHGCAQVDEQWACGKKYATDCPRAVTVKWKGVVDLGFSPDGRRLQKAVTAKTQAATRTKLEALKQQIKTTGSPLGTKSVREWGAFWVAGYENGKPQTYRAYSSLLNKWVFPMIGRKKVGDVRASDLRTIYDSMRNAEKPLSDSSVLKVHNMLSSMFEAARLERLAPSNVAKDIRAPKAAKSQRNTFTQDETKRILASSEIVRDGSKWLVSLWAGIRQGERCGATIDAVDLEAGTFTVKWNLVEGNFRHGCPDPSKCLKENGPHKGKPRPAGFCPQRRLIAPEGIDYRFLEGRHMLVPPKSGEERTFPLPESIMRRLQSHIESLSMRPNPHGLLWPSGDGSPMTNKEDQLEWEALLADAGIKRDRLTTHWARHTAISDLTNAGVAERVTGEIVGHKSPGVTGRYQHVASKDAIDAMGKLGERRVGNLSANEG